MTSVDPLRHVPELRAQITPLHETRFRGDFPDEVRALLAERGYDPGIVTPDADREAARHAFLARHEGALWVFAYGSLIWDPGVRFIEKRRATVAGYTRKMCIYDDAGGRGTVAAPGLIAGLDVAPGRRCDGTVFCIDATDVASETRYLWAREQIMPGYIPTMLSVQTPQGAVTALGFVVDHSQTIVRPDLPEDEQAHLIATGEGDLGSSYAYVENLLTRLDLLGIGDPDLRRIFVAAQALRA